MNVQPPKDKSCSTSAADWFTVAQAFKGKGCVIRCVEWTEEVVGILWYAWVKAYWLTGAEEEEEEGRMINFQHNAIRWEVPQVVH